MRNKKDIYLFISTHDCIPYRCFSEEDRDDLDKTIEKYGGSHIGWRGEVWRVYEIFDGNKSDDIYNKLKNKPYWGNLSFRKMRLLKDYHIFEHTGKNIPSYRRIN